MNDDGTMARLPDLELFAEKHGLKIISVADLVRYRIHKEPLIGGSSRPTCRPITACSTRCFTRTFVNGEDAPGDGDG
jgi:3,4-dihydroxy 2-butanone 4-phosphate synthase/GTP cyclohydrolase II